ncbi:MAG: hypothetical protein KatS3mg013_1402 [Actinomycetota bacterium]|jgi:hypothetical protein|nr:MAG: hypothetical protein KatS3mg013_1402 [Actinomycetota bacterium]
MRRLRTVLVWTLVLATSAGTGAWVASRSDPFPPGVTDPGAPAGPPDVASPAPARWRLRLGAQAVHTFRVGGTCRAGWGGDIRLVAVDERRLRGTGRLEPTEALACDFPTAQVQARALVVSVVGSVGGSGVRVRFRLQGVRPSDAQELSGLAASIDRARAVLDPGGRPVRVTLIRPDGRGGGHRSVVSAELRCVTGC